MGEETLVGPTDVPHDAGAPLAPSPDELSYLYASARRYLPKLPERWDSTVCGARPILGQAADETLLSRDHVVMDHEADGKPGFVTIAGGKLSSFRLMAEDTVDVAARRLGRPERCRTHLETLDGEPVKAIPDFELPNPSFKKFLAERPHLRELHALAHLGVCWSRHWFRRTPPLAAPEAFWAHYQAS
jgi:glycerol-3-phosphate dehydrogenase